MDGLHQPVGERRQPARGGDAGEFARLEGGLHAFLDAGEMPAQQIDRGFAPHRAAALRAPGELPDQLKHRQIRLGQRRACAAPTPCQEGRPRISFRRV